MIDWKYKDMNNFTEKHYKRLIKHLKNHYRFIDYYDYRTEDRAILWRHDIDISPHRALRLAKIDRDMGIKSTFFIYLHSPFYNALEPEIRNIFSKIIDIGHDIGLHYDIKHGSSILKEASLLYDITEDLIKAISFHNPIINNKSLSDRNLRGMVNASSDYIKENYKYISDSNGFWHEKKINIETPKLQVLTHPVWWTKSYMIPRLKVARAIEGRANAQHKQYDEFIRKYNKINPGSRLEYIQSISEKPPKESIIEEPGVYLGIPATKRIPTI